MKPGPIDYWFFTSMMMLCWGPVGVLAIMNLGVPTGKTTESLRGKYGH